jgi:hypothetical protein
MIKLLLAALAVGLLMLCDEPGTTIVLLNGTEAALPEELKGLKIYRVVYDSTDSYMDIAVLPGGSAGYSTGNTVLVGNGWDSPKEIKISSIVFENDSMVMARKAPK